jgi:nitroreductase
MSEATDIKGAAIVDAAITSRRSIRAFLPTPIERSVIEAILAVASRAPSGTNAQPWKVYVLEGDAKRRLLEAITSVYDDPVQLREHGEEYAYYPRKRVDPYLARRRKIGWDLYGLLQIGRADKERMHAQHGRNYVFFDAPVGMIFTTDRILERGSWLDYGMFIDEVRIPIPIREGERVD